MPEIQTPPCSPAEVATTTAALLSLGERFERYSLLLSAVALLVLLTTPLAFAPRGCLCLAVAAGLGEHFFALRTAFDYRIFASWAERWRLPGADPGADMASFDASLLAIRLGAGNPRPLRSVQDRALGARRLWLKQARYGLLQLLAFLTAILFVVLEN